MKRAQLNYAVDAVIAAAFLVAAVTGILFLLPPGAIRALSLGMPGMLGISFRTWHWLHDWSGVVATVGVLVHAALHYRWIVTMTRRTFGSADTPARRTARAPAAAPADAPATSGRRDQTAVADQATRPPPGRVASSGSAAPAGYATYRAAGRPDRRRITRRRFVAGAVGGLALAVLGGDLLSRLGAVTADAVHGSGGAPQAGGGQTQANGGATNGATNGAGAASGASGDGGGSGTAPQGGATGAVLVSVTASSCVGCGRCLSVCPVGVFAWDASGSHAVASNAGRCIRCHRCLQTCPAGAITVNG